MGKTFNTGRLGNGLFVDDNGRVGINTTSPTSRLHIINNTDGFVGRFTGGAASTVTAGIFANSTTGFASIGVQSNHQFRLFTNDADRLTVGTDGNIGIGTISPAYRLDVTTTATNSVFAATTTFAHSGGYLDHSAFLAPNMTGGALSVSFGKSASNYNTGKLVFNYAGNGSTSNSVGLGFYNADNLLVVRGNGHIGIGTTSPAAQLHMYNGGSTVRLRMESGSTQAALLDFYNSTTARWSIGIDNTQSYGKLENRVLATDAIRFYDSNNNVVLVPSSGKVGIGTDTPGSSLQVVGGDIWLGSYHAESKLALGADTNHYVKYNNSLDGAEVSGYSGVLFSTLGGTERMRITTAGNVGIGLTNPGHKVEIWNTTHNVFRVVNTGSANGNSPTAQFLNSYGNHSWGITAEFRVGASGGEDRPSILFSNGFDNNTWACGFGYADSSYFRINRDQGPYSGSWGVTLFSLDRSGNYSFSGSNVSDRRNKKDIVYISDSQLDTILKLRPATFVKKSPGKEEYSEHTHTGFIAQDILEENIPNLVHGSEEKGYGLDYDGILALAVKAIQELKTEIEILKNK